MKARQVVGFVLIFVCTFIATWFAPFAVPNHWPNPAEFIGWLAVVVVGHWLVVGVHELGHAGVGICQGLTLKQFAIGPLLIDWSQGRPRSRRLRQRGPSGFVRIVGDGAVSESHPRAYLWMALGGPIAGILASAILLELGLIWVQGTGWLSTGLFAAGAWGVVINVASLVPVRRGLSRTDGGWMLAMVRDREGAYALLGAMRWVDTLQSLVAPSSWPPDMVADQEMALLRPEPLSSMQTDLAILAGNLLYYYYADRGDWIEAHHVIARAADLPRTSLADRGPNSRFEAVDLLYAAHLALRGRNPTAARARLAHIHPKSQIRRNSLYPGAEAAIALAEGDPETALDLATKARKKLAPSLAFCAADKVEDSWWEAVIAQARAKLPPDGNPRRRPATAASGSEETFAWDPGRPSHARNIWIWTRQLAPDQGLSA